MLWQKLAARIGLDPVVVQSNWRTGVDPEVLASALAEHPDVKAVCVVQNETSTGCATRIDEVRAAMDAAGTDALLMVDTISSLASIDMRMDEWGVDVIVAGSQKGLMLPPGMAFNAVSPKAMNAHKAAQLQRAYWDWGDMIGPNAAGYFPYTPATTLLYGLVEAIDMLEEEGLSNVYAHHNRNATATNDGRRRWHRRYRRLHSHNHPVRCAHFPTLPRHTNAIYAADANEHPGRPGQSSADRNASRRTNHSDHQYQSNRLL
jgi:alanine-glyoxylate transaminase/serine-glyoxylate transaminase/serine-pyruvate transaminase